MKLMFKQKLFSWFDSYNVYDRQGNVYFRVDGKFSIGHSFDIFDYEGYKIASLKQELFHLRPHYKMYIDDEYVGTITRVFNFFNPKILVDYRSWTVEGDWVQWNYVVYNKEGYDIATISKELFNMTDTYEINVNFERDALIVLMITLAIDAMKCSSAKGYK